LFSSVILGITVYGEELTKSGGSHAGAAYVGLGIAVAGIALLAGSEAPALPAEPTTPDVPQFR
jgi:hypothetical protein